MSLCSVTARLKPFSIAEDRDIQVIRLNPLCKWTSWSHQPFQRELNMRNHNHRRLDALYVGFISTSQT